MKNQNIVSEDEASKKAEELHMQSFRVSVEYEIGIDEFLNYIANDLRESNN